MAADVQQAHRPGALKQQNKSHKHGKHKSKGQLDKETKGKGAATVSVHKLYWKPEFPHSKSHHEINYFDFFSLGRVSVKTATKRNKFLQRKHDRKHHVSVYWCF